MPQVDVHPIPITPGDEPTPDLRPEDSRVKSRLAGGGGRVLVRGVEHSAQPSVAEAQATHLDHPEQDKGTGRWIEVDEHVRAVHAGRDESDQGQQRGHQHEAGDGPAHGAIERIGVEEPKLLNQGPHKQEVQVAEPGHTRDRDQTIDDDDGTGEGCERPPRRGFVEMHGNRHHSGEADVDGEEPQRLADAQAGLTEEVGRNSELAGHGQPDTGEADEHGDGHSEPAQASTQIIGPGAATGTSAAPAGDACVSADDEEQRHDLEEPRCGSESWSAGQRDGRLHSTIGADHRRAHHRVEDDHDDEAAEAKEIDGPVAVGLGRAAAALDFVVARVGMTVKRSGR